jgi:hypothetical protein
MQFEIEQRAVLVADDEDLSYAGIWVTP